MYVSNIDGATAATPAILRPKSMAIGIDSDDGDAGCYTPAGV